MTAQYEDLRTLSPQDAAAYTAHQAAAAAGKAALESNPFAPMVTAEVPVLQALTTRDNAPEVVAVAQATLSELSHVITDTPHNAK